MAACLARLLVALGILLGGAIPSAAEAVVRLPTSQSIAASPVPDRGADAANAISYFQARHYQADLGRFTTIDPVYTWEENLLDPQRWNRYSYVRNNPLRWVDPDGRSPAAAIMGTIGSAVYIAFNAYQNVQQGRDWWQNWGVEGAKGFVVGASLGLLAPAAAALPSAATPLATQAVGAARTIDPAKVRFSQSSIKATFGDGGSIDDLVVGLRNGTIKANDVASIRLVERNNHLYTLDNRRLEAFKRAGVDIPYRMATPREIAEEAWKFTTRNGGVAVRVRGQ